MSTSSQNPQHGPALALVQLLTEFPELPSLFWSISPDGFLNGSAYSLSDPAVTAQALMRVLGGAMHEQDYTASTDGLTRRALHVSTTWRDVSIHLTLVGSPVAAMRVVAA